MLHLANVNHLFYSRRYLHYVEMVIDHFVDEQWASPTNRMFVRRTIDEHITEVASLEIRSKAVAIMLIFRIEEVDISVFTYLPVNIFHQFVLLIRTSSTLAEWLGPDLIVNEERNRGVVFPTKNEAITGEASVPVFQ